MACPVTPQTIQNAILSDVNNTLETSNLFNKNEQGEFTPKTEAEAPSKTPIQESNLTNNQITEYGHRILTGEYRIERLSPEEEQGRSRGGQRNVEASLVTGRSQGTVRETEENITQLANDQQEALEAYAKSKGIWIDNYEGTYGTELDRGQEAVVLYNKDTPNVVTKVKSMSFQYTTPADFLDGVSLHNFLFPETVYEVVGFTNRDGELNAIVQQPLVKEGESTTREDVDTFLSKSGFKNVGEDTYISDDYIISDLHLGNVIKSPEVNLLFIDPVIHLNTKDSGYGGNREIGDNSIVATGDAPNITVLPANNVFFHLIGEKGAKALDEEFEETQRQDDKELAEQLEKKYGISEEDWQDKTTKSEQKLKIKQATGWERDNGGDWVYEIQDGKIKDYSTDKPTTLGNIFDSEELYRAYPFLKDVRVNFFTPQTPAENTLSAFVSGSTLNINKNDVQRKSAPLVHEIHHLVSNHEGFERGGSPEAAKTAIIEINNAIANGNGEGSLSSPIRRLKRGIERAFGVATFNIASLSEVNFKTIALAVYRNLRGEITARTLENRTEFTPEERSNSLISDNEDSPRVTSIQNPLMSRQESVLQQINNEYDEPDLVSLEDGKVKITPSEDLVNAYMDTYEAQQEAESIVAPIATAKPQDKQLKAPQYLKNKITALLTRMGVKVESINNLLVNGERLNEDAVALPLQALVAYAEGQEDKLPEEAFHIAVELLSQTNPGLLNKMFTKITKLPIYQEVFDKYSQDPSYQREGGKPDLVKIKKEAIGQQLALQIEQEEDVKSWWQKAIDFLKSLFTNSNINLSPFKQALDEIFNNDIGDVRNTLLKSKEYLLSQGLNENIADQIIKLANSPISDDALSFKVAQITPDVAYFSKASESTDATYKKVKTRDITGDHKPITEKIEDFLRSKGAKGEGVLREMQKQEKSSSRKDLSNILDRYIDENGYQRNTPLRFTKSNLSKNDYNKLEAWTVGMLSSFPTNTRFILNQKISGKTTEATADLLALTPDNKTHIINFYSSDEEKLDHLEEQALNIATTNAKGILTNDYKVKKFGKVRTLTVPFTESSDISKEAQAADGFLVTPSIYESVGIEKIDNLLSSLNNLRKEILSDRRASTKQDVLNKEIVRRVFGSIKAIQLKGDVRPLAQLAKQAKLNLDAVESEYYRRFSGKTLTDLPVKEIQEFAHRLNSVLEVATYFRAANTVFATAAKENPALFQDMTSPLRTLNEAVSTLSETKARIDTVNEAFSNDFIAAQAQVTNLTHIERPIDMVSGWMKQLSQTPTKATAVLNKLWNNINRKIDQETHTIFHKTLKPIQLAYDAMLKQKGVGLRGERWQFITQRDDKGNYVHKLFHKYDYDRFQAELLKAQQSNDKAWIKKNVDIKAYDAWFQIAKKDRFEAYDSIEYSYDEDLDQDFKNQRKEDWLDTYDLSRNLSDDNKKITEFITDKHLSKRYKELSSNKAAKDLYDFVYNLNQRAYKAHALNEKQAREMLPFLRKTGEEKILTGGQLTIGEGLYRSLTNSSDKRLHGYINQQTGDLEDRLPFYYTSDISSENPDGTRNYSNVSQDVFKVLPLYINQVVRYEHSDEVESELLLVGKVEALKQSIATNLVGEKIPGSSPIPNNEKNTDYYYKMLRGTIYGQRKGKGEFDVKIANTGNKWAKKINNSIFGGKKVLSEATGTVTVANIIDTANRLFTMKILGLNFGIPLANFFGGNMQILIESGKWFPAKDFVKHEIMTLYGKATRTEGKINAGMQEFFLFDVDAGDNHRFARKFSMARALRQTIAQRLMQPNSMAEQPLQVAIGMAMCDNTMVVNGQLVNINEYVRKDSKYDDFYNASKEERSAMKKEQNERIAQLKETQAISKTAQIKGDDLIIPGIERGDQTVLDFVAHVQNMIRNATGGGNTEDIRLANQNIIMRSMMIFKSWLPRLVYRRVSKLQYNQLAQQYEMGRFSALSQLLRGNFLLAGNRAYNIISGNAKGIELMREMYDKEKTKYFERTGDDLDMNEKEFLDMYSRLIGQSMKEMATWAALWTLFLGMGAALPPEDKRSQGWRYAFKMMDKVKGEMDIYVNPMQWYKMGSQSAIPALGVIRDGYQIAKNIGNTVEYTITGDQQLKKETHLYKSVANALPILKQSNDWIAIFDEEYGKSLGLTIKKPQ